MDPHYADETVTLFQADLHELGGLRPAAAGVTGPPYNAGIAYDGYDDIPPGLSGGSWPRPPPGRLRRS